MKKVITTILTTLFAVICTTSIVLTVLFIGFNKRTSHNWRERTSDNVHVLVPIENVTGINIPAALKSGCYIKEGMNYHAGSGYCHCMAICLPDQEGLNVSSARIIDVYGSQCTVAFNFSNDIECLIKENYPLSNLSYDEMKVKMADDGIKTEIYRGGFVIRDHTSVIPINRIPVGSILIILDITGVIILMFVVVRRKMKAPIPQ